MTCVHSFSKCCNGKSSHIFGSFDNNLDRAGFYDQNLSVDENRTAYLEKSGIEWPSVWVICLCYVCWAVGTTALASISLPLAICLLALTITLHSSLQHEVIHGHPLPSQFMSEMLVFPAIGLLVPFERFRDLHLAHHTDANLTDPYDDPETQYLHPVVWERLGRPTKLLFALNGSLLGRMFLGPFISQYAFMRDDLRLIRSGASHVRRAWVLHVIGVVPVLLWLWFVGTIPIWAYLLGVYLGMAILRIRIFLEHQAHIHNGGRTVIIEDRGLLAFLFLNNNFHAVHHIKPATPWYELPTLYAENRENFLERNLGYSYPSYKSVMARYLFRAKEPVAHPVINK